MSELQTKLPTDTWIEATWKEYIQAVADPQLEKAKCYYHNRRLRIEMPPVGPNHASDNTVIIGMINLFCTIKGIPQKGLTNCSYRKTGIRECQPDVSYYIGERVKLAPQGSSVVSLDSHFPPDLVIEVADTSFADDIGEKRMLYEDMQVREYWVVDVRKAQIIAFSMIANSGSQRITESQVLPELPLSLLEESLQRSRNLDQTQVGTWFLEQIQVD